jgi:hypothetical protein
MMEAPDKYTHFVAFLWKVSWQDISLGLSLHVGKAPHIEIHLPFCFIKIGWEEEYRGRPLNYKDLSKRGYYIFGKPEWMVKP